MISIIRISRDFRGLFAVISSARNVNFRTRNPPEPHFDRKRMIEICKPIILPDRSPEWDSCTIQKDTAKPPAHPYEVLLSLDLKKSLDISRMIMFYHLGPLRNRTQIEVRNSFFKENFHFYAYSPTVMKLAVDGTPYSSVLHLYESNTAVVFSEEIAVNKFLKVNKKVQNQGVALLGGIIDDVFYSKNQIQKIGDLFKKDPHLELSLLLDCVPSKIRSTVNHHTQLLSHYLTQASKET